MVICARMLHRHVERVNESTGSTGERVSSRKALKMPGIPYGLIHRTIIIIITDRQTNVSK